MTPFLQALVGAILWTFANLLYVDLKRKGVRSFSRIVAFWFGMPTTWLSLILVREGRQPRFDQHGDDDAALLARVRLDRARRIAEERRAGGRDASPRDVAGPVLPPDEEDAGGARRAGKTDTT